MAHIRSFSEEGPNTVDNGILMRSDMHALFDAGYLTVDYDRAGVSRVVVSQRLHEDFGNGKDYYPYHGRQLAVVPDRRSLRPTRRPLGRILARAGADSAAPDFAHPRHPLHFQTRLWV